MFATVLQFAFYYPLKVIVFLLFFTVPLKRRKYFYFRAAGFGSVVAGRMGGPLTEKLPEPAEELWRLLKMGKE